MAQEYVVITGISGNLGRLLAKRLHKEEHIIGIDRRPFDDRPKDIIHYQIDIRRNKADEIFRNHRIKAIYHLGVMHNPRQRNDLRYSWNILGTSKILSFCGKYKIPKFVYLSSADIYGAGPGNTNFMPETAPLQGWRGSAPLRDAVETDMLVQSFFWKDPDTDIIILRPVHIVGPHMDNGPMRFFNLSAVPVALGFDPMIQIIHENDLIEALYLCLNKKVRGVFNLEGGGNVPLSIVLNSLKVKKIPFLHLALHPILKKMWDFKLTDFTPDQMNNLLYICMVDGTRAREELGFKSKLSIKDTINSIKKAQ